MTRKGASASKPTKKPSVPSKPKTVGKEDPAFYAALGRAIKVARTELGIERRELAEQANVSYAYLSDIETGRGRPGSRSLLAIAAALGRPVAELMHEAEVYRQRMTGEPSTAFEVPWWAGDEPAVGTPGGRRWFHEQAGSELAEPAASGPPPAAKAPSARELRAAWRERLEGEDAQARAELHAIVDRLSREDLDAALTIARRLADTNRAR